MLPRGSGRTLLFQEAPTTNVPYSPALVPSGHCSRASSLGLIELVSKLLLAGRNALHSSNFIHACSGLGSQPDILYMPPNFAVRQ